LAIIKEDVMIIYEEFYESNWGTEYKFEVENIADKSKIDYQWKLNWDSGQLIYEADDIKEGIKSVLDSIDMAFKMIANFAMPVIISIKSKQIKDYYYFELGLTEGSFAESYISVNNKVYTFEDYEEGLAILNDVRDALKQTFLSFWK